MSAASRPTSSAARVLRVLKALRGHTLRGLSNTELAQALGESPANITRYMDVLIAEGFVTRYGDTGRFAPSIAFLQYAVATAEELNRGAARIQEMSARISAHT
ncbi:helix-turn-helix domain-containing protein [Pseudomonas nitroreducens]|uniref:Helix-turn-helix domain-containing protein n=1 Tax=Pseudomonas nitroreducens TaxID=46680 RepID=A0ABS0KQP5_PSENT|nr:helix-turn-helix domain-containing protein [Pseudomonas nitroreducens]MBG6289685.1 helix-turn-helix domain-containing protein [Pseudomonas nitroreducens]